MIETTNVFCDWVTAVAYPFQTNSFLRNMLRFEDTISVNKAYHHARAVQYYPSGIRHYFTPDDPDKSPVIVIDGEANNHLRKVYGEQGALKVISILARNSIHFSRIDLTVDVMDGGFQVLGIERLIASNRLRFGRRTVTTVKRDQGTAGMTIYVGSRSSPLMLRIYDKSAESKGKIPASRFEFEVKAEAAYEVTSVLASFGGHLKASSIYNGLLGQFADWSEVPAIEALRYGEVTTVDAHRRERLHSRKEWLSRQVLPTFVKDMNGEGGELWRWMVQRVEEARLGAQ